MAHTNLISLFSDIADAIREKTGENGLIKADDFPSAIAAIPTGGGGGNIVGGEVSISDVGMAYSIHVSIDDIGFTPSYLMFFRKDLSDFSGSLADGYVVIGAIRDLSNNIAFEFSARNVSGYEFNIDRSTLRNTYVYLNGDVVYIKGSSARLFKAGTYYWIAVK